MKKTNDSIAIEVKGVSKKYRYTKERPVLAKTLFSRSKSQEFWALKDVSLKIKKGETVGIIGENGSGKSTLLKIIAGITIPTKGSVKVNGRICSLIELGAGFHPDLTGRENVYLNGMLLGLTRKEIDGRFNSITEFADIGNFVDEPVRFYSYGMIVRLGFSVAVHLDPDILVVDEVLAVGDEQFQNKCKERIAELKRKGVTLVFVSHSMDLIQSTCRKAVWIHKAQKRFEDIAKNVIQRYLLYEQSR
ncbi:MAG: ATP-binding protein [Candidatus Blackburnbacteria bacterium RIFCSPHIGHO2_02_FULL_39_13]|uniref:ATP-binding protein n=1 Tax=Candidatus Blackburnbacteria bacterium RIFCSPLOWO2_01_FULL_40_20 TaxID=1797519 RepID=A0A1G1VCH7_9BACT|nr:MAG: ATP-binding protein [Candidatus Blackburnbacteria bacterium RIFCSPHIGHO2_02_FULL_39_13]OGY13148.1 MAG: ATP-binding protein [Candidatus Blackburnbacteria bacterium RIFCSPLOWO2_01_FULL_40_20]